jgi:hypothetical protein
METSPASLTPAITWYTARNRCDDESGAAAAESDGAVDACRLDGSCERHGAGNDCRAVRPHRLAGPWWTEHEDIMGRTPA